jgi:hypothetical protein
MVRAFIVTYFRTVANAGGAMEGGVLPQLIAQAE